MFLSCMRFSQVSILHNQILIFTFHYFTRCVLFLLVCSCVSSSSCVLHICIQYNACYDLFYILDLNTKQYCIYYYSIQPFEKTKGKKEIFIIKFLKNANNLMRKTYMTFTSLFPYHIWELESIYIKQMIVQGDMHFKTMSLLQIM